MKTQGANHKEYGHGVIVASRGYSAREPDFDTEERLDFVIDGGRFSSAVWRLDERLVTNFDHRARGAGRPNLSRIFIGKQSLNRLLVTEGVPLRKWTGIDGDNDDEQSPSE